MNRAHTTQNGLEKVYATQLTKNHSNYVTPLMMIHQEMIADIDEKSRKITKWKWKSIHTLRTPIHKHVRTYAFMANFLIVQRWCWNRSDRSDMSVRNEIISFQYAFVCTYVCHLNVLLITGGPFAGIGANFFFRYISIYEDEKHECAHSGTNCGRSHTSAQQSSIFNVHYSVPLRMNRMNGSTLAHKHHTPAPTTPSHTTKKHECVLHQIERLNTGKSNLKPGMCRLRVDLYSLQYASTATVLSRNRLIFKLFQISELKHHANKKIHSNRQCKIYGAERGSGRLEFEFELER